MKLENARDRARSVPYRYRRHKRRPLVGPTGSPFLDDLVLQTKSCRWFSRSKSLDSRKRDALRDEAIISMSVAGKVTDNSIMEVGRSRPQFQYSREELMEIKNQPLSKRRPECLDISNNKIVCRPLDRKPSDTPPEDERTGRGEQVAENHGKRRSGDPRERIRKEQDGIVLSPQRRSFNSGCFVNVSQPPARRPESPIGKPEVSHREPVRRIGSGRILARNTWDFRENEKLEPERPEFTFRPGGGPLRERDSRDNRDSGRDRDRERDERNDRFERRSFGDRDRDRDRGNSERNERNDRNHPVDREKDRRDRRYGNDRRRTFSENKEPEEPEWFSSGPTSQHDTIELRGFEDIPEEKVVKIGSAKSKKQSSAQKKRGKKKEEKEEKQSEVASGPKGRSTPTAMDQPMNPVPTPHSPISERNERPSPVPKEKTGLSQSDRTEPSSSDAADNSSLNKAQENSHSDFNLDDFLKSDTFPGVPGLLTNGVGSNGSSGSRFSQWFKRESPVQQVDTRRASIQDELLNNLLNDITEPNIQIPSVTESNTYFAPISPANTTNNATPATGVKLLEMLQRGGTPSQNGQGDVANNVVPLMKNSSIKDMEVGGKVVHSLEELEARMRGGAPAPTAAETRRVNKTEDLSAFKKLLAQVTGGQAVPAANGPIPQKPQPIILMQVLNNQLKTQQQVAQQQQLAEQLHASTFNHGGPLGPAQHPHQAQVQHENLMKVLQIQQQQQKQRQQQQSDMLSLMLGSQRMVGVSPVPPDMQMIVNNAPSSRELLQRPEAQAIIKGLQQGEITKQHLIQQLQNPAIQHRHREVLVNILKLYGGTTPRTVSPHPVAPTPQDHILQQMLYQQQHQQQRIPSPMNTAYCPAPIISPNLAPSPNTLTVQHPVMQHRVPSPREIVMHTQSIIQNALIKKKLEEQQENFRKRQEQQQQQQRVSSPVISSTKQTLSPTPLAFTPTSVLRKMTAEKETEGNNDPTKLTAQSQAAQMQQMQSTVQLLAQGVLSRHAALRPQPVQPSWSNPTIKQHPGRPIVRGGGGNQFHHSSNIDFQQQQQQQQQQRATSGIYGNPARSKHTMATPLPMSNVPQYNVNANPVIGQRANHMNNHMKSQHVQSHLSMQQQPQQQQQPRSVNPQLQQIVMNQNYNSARTEGRAVQPQQMNMGVGRQASPGLGYMGSNGGDLSPTSNQLARWFSPELLAQARAGKLPDLGHSNVLSLEDLERLQHASTTVHN
ncbi:eukaryotic translation initiation factor 4E transporter isoform X3 [Orussus abietinus]|uniref:eukaryotic translation initiation factor 4E transporter isoform X3 n=1 Tax=Orussus abietinus TaxID=222816 RepID=UPI000C716020|nr:eukaryotic translation initiation factor 4E transporter isoform X3 [Orussus abietinus]